MDGVGFIVMVEVEVEENLLGTARERVGNRSRSDILAVGEKERLGGVVCFKGHFEALMTQIAIGCMYSETACCSSNVKNSNKTATEQQNSLSHRSVTLSFPIEDKVQH